MTNLKVTVTAHGLQGDRECVPEPWGMPQDPTPETRSMTMRSQNQTMVDGVGRRIARSEMDAIFGKRRLENAMDEGPPFGAAKWHGRPPNEWMPQKSSFARGLTQLYDCSAFTLRRADRIVPIQFGKDEDLNMTIGHAPPEGTPMMPGTEHQARQSYHMNNVVSLMSALVVGPHAGDQGKGETVVALQQGCTSGSLIRTTKILATNRTWDMA